MPAPTLDIPSLRERVPAAEWQMRCDLAAAYRLVALFGWDDLVFTHISARVPDAPDQFLINPYGLFFEEITASSLVKVDHHGQPVMETAFPVNPAGFVIHSAVHEGRPEVNCVLHTHTLHGVAVSAQADGLLPISQQSGFPLGSLAYHGYEGVALRDEEKSRLVADLGNANNPAAHWPASTAWPGARWPGTANTSTSVSRTRRLAGRWAANPVAGL